MYFHVSGHEELELDFTKQFHTNMEMTKIALLEVELLSEIPNVTFNMLHIIILKQYSESCCRGLSFWG